MSYCLEYQYFSLPVKIQNYQKGSSLWISARFLKMDILDRVIDQPAAFC